MHKGGGEGGVAGNSCTPSKDFIKLEYKNAIKHKNWRPPLRFFSQPQVPPSKEFENDCASMGKQVTGGWKVLLQIKLIARN
jgi:hypothetical protein